MRSLAISCDLLKLKNISALAFLARAVRTRWEVGLVAERGPGAGHIIYTPIEVQQQTQNKKEEEKNE